MSMSMSISNEDEPEIPELDDERDDGPDEDDDERPRGRTKADEPDEDDEEQTPEELKAEVARLRASLAKANSSGNRRRQQIKELRAAQSKIDDVDDDEPDEESDDEKSKAKPASADARAIQRRIDKAKKETRRQLEEEHKRDLIETRAESAFTRAGVSEKNLRLLKRELDLDEIDFDAKTRKVEGLDEEIDRLRAEFPDLFRGSKAARRRVNGGDDRDGGRKAKPLSTNEQQAALLRAGVR